MGDSQTTDPVSPETKLTPGLESWLDEHLSNIRKRIDHDLVAEAHDGELEAKQVADVALRHAPGQPAEPSQSLWSRLSTMCQEFFGSARSWPSSSVSCPPGPRIHLSATSRKFSQEQSSEPQALRRAASSGALRKIDVRRGSETWTEHSRCGWRR